MRAACCIKKEGAKTRVQNWNKQKNFTLYIESPRSNSLEETQAPLIRHAGCFAPARIQAEASPLIFSATVKDGASVLLKIHTLCSF